MIPVRLERQPLRILVAPAPKKIIFKRPDGTTFEKVAVFTNTGTDGKIEYVSVDGDLDIAGRWRLQAYVATSAGTWRTDVGDFKVFENL